jgi:hypothetical protein
VNHLRSKRSVEGAKINAGVAVIYLKYNEPDQTLGNLLGSLLKQLIEEHHTIPKPLHDLYNHHRVRGTSPSPEELSGIISSTIGTYDEVFIVVDALDECSEEVRWGLLEKLRGFQPKGHVMITSRALDSIQEELEEFERQEIRADKADMELFIDQQILKNRNLQRIVKKSPNMRDDIKEGVIRTADNMYGIQPTISACISPTQY